MLRRMIGKDACNSGGFFITIAPKTKRKSWAFLDKSVARLLSKSQVILKSQLFRNLEAQPFPTIMVTAMLWAVTLPVVSQRAHIRGVSLQVAWWNHALKCLAEDL